MRPNGSESLKKTNLHPPWLAVPCEGGCVNQAIQQLHAVPNSNPTDYLCSDTPVALDEPDARSSPTRLCGTSDWRRVCQVHRVDLEFCP